MRPAVPQRHAEALRRAHRYVGAPLSWRSEEGEGEEVCGSHHEGAGILEASHPLTLVGHLARRARVLDENPEGRVGI